MGIEQDDNSNTLDELNKINQDTPSKNDTLPKEKEVLKNQGVNGILPDKQQRPRKNDSTY
jgi:hypothetical protein